MATNFTNSTRVPREIVLQEEGLPETGLPQRPNRAVFRRRTRSIVTLLLASVFLMAATHLAAQDLPKRLQKKMDRETENRPLPTPVATDSFKTVVAAKPLSEPVKIDEVTWTLALDIGADTPMSCAVYLDYVDLANSLKTNSIFNFERVEQTYKRPIKTRGVDKVDVQRLEGTLAVTLDWIYQVEKGDDLIVGLLKQKAAYHDGGTLYCVHNELGFRQSFDRVFQDFLRNLDLFSLQEPEPYYQQIHIFEIQGIQVGFVRTRFLLDKDGDTRSEVLTTLVVPSGEDLNVSDSIHLEFIRPNGDLINKLAVEQVNGEHSRVKLDPLDSEDPANKIWKATGEHRGLALDHTLTSTRPIGSQLTVVNSTRELMNSTQAGQRDFLLWIASASPDRFIRASLVVEEKGTGARQGTLTTGPLSLSVSLQSPGVFGGTAMDLGGATMTSRLVEIVGNPLAGLEP